MQLSANQYAEGNTFSAINFLRTFRQLKEGNTVPPKG